MSAEQEQFLQAARALALEQMPYMASVLFAFRAVDAPGLGTFACDPHLRLYIDFNSAVEQGVDYSAQALLHEAMHIFAQDHLLLGELGENERDPQAQRLANVASDAANNDDLRVAGCAIFADDNRWGHVLPASIGEPDFQTSHAYYRALRVKASPPPSVASGAGGGQPTSGGGTSDGQGGDNSGEYSGCGSASGNPWGGELAAHDDLGGQAPAATQEQVDRVNIATAVAITEHRAKARGSVPGGMAELADMRLRPSTVPWQKVLGVMLRGSLRNALGGIHDTYDRVNRRRHRGIPVGAGRAIVPANVRPTPHVVAIRDTSGSMDASDLEAVTSEIVAISQRIGIKGRDLVVMDYDAANAGVRSYRGPRDLAKVNGRGGTSMDQAILEALGMAPRPSAIIVLTDGFTPWPDPRPRTRVPVIACIVSDNPEKPVAAVPDWIRHLVIPSKVGA